MGGPALHALAVGGDQDEAVDEAAEGAVAVVVLAVDVTGHAGPDRDELGAGRDRREPAARQEHRQNVGEAQSCLAVEPAGVAVEPQDAIGPRALHHEPARRRRHRGVPVGSAQTTRDHRLPVRRQPWLPGAVHPSASHRMTAPARHLLQGEPSVPRDHGAQRASHAGPQTGP